MSEEDKKINELNLDENNKSLSENRIKKDLEEKNKKKQNENIKEEAEIDLDSAMPQTKEEEINEEELSIEQNLNEEINKLRDEKLRLLAEMENLRKRSDRERVDSIKYGSFNLAKDMLSPDDNLGRALEAISEEEEKTETVKNLIDGLKMVQKEFSSILQRYGIKKIDALNKKFDHNFHQAMIEIEDNQVDPGTVVQEIQSGYIMHDKLLRPSMVGVSKNSEKSKEEQEKN